MRSKLDFMRRIAAGALCLLFCAVGLTQPARASYEAIDTKRSCSLTIKYLHPGQTVNIYRVADAFDGNGNLSFRPAGSFAPLMDGLLKELNVKSLNRIASATVWNDLARKLDFEVLYRNISPDKTGRTAADGDGASVSFSGLTPGLYLVSGLNYSVAEEQPDMTVRTAYYSVSPYLICLPNWKTASTGSGGSGGWGYHEVMELRGKTYESSDEKVAVSVSKLWLDPDNGKPVSDHPDSVWVQLFRDGGPYGKAVELKAGALDLSEWTKVDPGDPDSAEYASGNWYCVWKGLENGHHWWIQELEIDGYHSVVEGNGSSNIVVKNYPEGSSETPSPSPPPVSDPPTTTPPVSDPPATTPPVTNPPTTTPPVTNPPTTNPPATNPPATNPPATDLPQEEFTIEDEDTPLGLPSIDEVESGGRERPEDLEEIEIDDLDVPLGDLPQTGQLWWPVPLLAISGMFLLLLGWGRRRRGESDEE